LMNYPNKVDLQKYAIDLYRKLQWNILILKSSP
jgi:hypothetical protein